MPFRFLFFSCLVILCASVSAVTKAQVPIDIGSRLELFVDDDLVESISGNTVFDLKKPEAQEVVLVTDAPWEGNVCAYYTVFQDESLYRMYYRGLHYDTTTGSFPHEEVTCYAESVDGINWTKPDLGLVEFEGSTQNNIIWSGAGSHNFTPFKDSNPNAAPDALYKAFARNAVAGGPTGLYALKSPDGINWSLMSETPVITDGAFDSQNLGFWDEERGCYAAYYRDFLSGVRDIKTATSDDFLNWDSHGFLNYPDGTLTEHLYTNAISPYIRASHQLLGFPTRYNPSTQQVEPILMSSRDGFNFERWEEALIPITAPEDRDGNRSNYMGSGMAILPYSDREISMYAPEAYYEGSDSRLRRFTYRVDGFVSANSTGGIGQLLTKPLVFDGDSLQVNFATFDQGTVRVELQDINGNPIPGFTLNDCQTLSGDEIDQILYWNGSSDLSQLAGTPVQILYELNNADLYSYQFVCHIPGDANGDGIVDGSDVTILAGNWQYGVIGGGATREMGDFNGDGRVDGSDVTILAGNWQYGVTATTASIPEPSTLIILFTLVVSSMFWGHRSFCR